MKDRADFGEIAQPPPLGMLVESEGYHAFLHRCSSCHEPPDPSMHKPGEWQGIVRRMSDWIRAVGVMPMPVADSAAIHAFLERAAARRERNSGRGAGSILMGLPILEQEVAAALRAVPERLPETLEQLAGLVRELPGILRELRQRSASPPGSAAQA